jgi:hypothetical protein
MTHPLIAALTLFAACACAAQTPAPAAAPVRLRGTIEKIDSQSMTVKERSGEVITLVLPASLGVTEILPIDIAAIKPGSYIGSAAMPRADGTLEALEVQVFPETMRGVGEGHRAYDLQPQSTMTNAAVAELTASATGRTLKLKYKDGEKTLVIPANVPVVTYQPADRSLLVVGAKVIVTAELRDGQPTALRVQAGRNGFTPPM